MLRVLRDANAPLDMITVARDFHCPHCDLMTRRTGAVRPVRVSRSKELGHTISIDACHWKRNRGGRAAIIVNIIDEASRFHVALVLEEGNELGNLTTMDYMEAVRMSWFRFARAPAVIRVDSEGAFESLEFREWCAARGIEFQFAAGEAHWQIGNFQRRRVRRQTYDGYSTLQWWFGTQCAREVEEHGLGELGQALNDDWNFRQLPKQPLFVPTLGPV